jgi:hypothetical protein
MTTKSNQWDRYYQLRITIIDYSAPKNRISEQWNGKEAVMAQYKVSHQHFHEGTEE